MKLNTVAIVLLGVFTGCASDCEQHVYKHTEHEFISLEISGESRDKFVLYHSHKDFDGEYIEMEYRGDFIKDSVDASVERYLQTGQIPMKNDLF
jgi:hypothetical protein